MEPTEILFVINMNTISIIPSTIQPREGRFTYSKTRSVFSSEERFQQTIFTINSIQTSLPNSKVVLIDSSDEYKQYYNTFKHFNNFEYVPLKELSRSSFEIVNTHLNKSLCESLILNSYFKEEKKTIKAYDYVLKGCGRYFYFNLNEKYFDNKNVDKIFFKYPLSFEWNNSWNYSFIDMRNSQNDNKIYQYCTVLYAFGSMHLEKFIDINNACIHLLNQKSMLNYDIETLSYYFTRPFKNNIIETEWKVCGWDGTSGRFMYY